VVAYPPLLESEVDPDPLVQFDRWYDHARAQPMPHADAAALATATPDGAPSARVVLLKERQGDGFIFYTNYASQKACELDDNPRAALVFFWPTLDRQIRVTGTVTRVTRQESERYFATRHRGSQIGAWASRQSEHVGSREELDAKVAEIARRYAGAEVPCPPEWGGYRLRAERLEFWQSRPDRLHDRLRYTRAPDGAWHLERLWP
jgi:pyridoxamine 5'-phosphate oxidase